MEKHKKVFMTGIGGIGMSGLARLYLHEGIEVVGLDRAETPITKALQEEGATVIIGQGVENVPEDADIVVYTDAVKEDNPERVRARELGIPEEQFFKALGDVANEYYLIAVSGTHGKTTTTAMTIEILEEAGLDPTAVVGSLRAKTGTNFRAGKSKYFVVEADEYNRHFHNFTPDVLIITNIEHDHVDCFSSLEEVQEAFRVMAERIPETGCVVAEVSNPTVAPVIAGISASVIDYTQFFNPERKLLQPGVHNQMNAAAAVGAATHLGISVEDADKALANFRGTWRRFEYKGELNGAKVYDDYAHHPTEIQVTIGGARELDPKKRIVAVFQPHTFSRTTRLFDGFVSALGKADRVLLAPIYAAREVNESGVSSEQLRDKIAEGDTSVESFESLDAIAAALKDSVDSDDIVLVMGAGDITKVSALLT